jgi:hypothetical protein
MTNVSTTATRLTAQDIIDHRICPLRHELTAHAGHTRSGSESRLAPMDEAIRAMLRCYYRHSRRNLGELSIIAEASQHTLTILEGGAIRPLDLGHAKFFAALAGYDELSEELGVGGQMRLGPSLSVRLCGATLACRPDLVWIANDEINVAWWYWTEPRPERLLIDSMIVQCALRSQSVMEEIKYHTITLQPPVRNEPIVLDEDRFVAGLDLIDEAIRDIRATVKPTPRFGRHCRSCPCVEHCRMEASETTSGACDRAA